MARACPFSAGLIDIHLHLKPALAALYGDAAQLAAWFDADTPDLPPAVRALDRALLIYDKFTTFCLSLQVLSLPFPENNTRIKTEKIIKRLTLIWEILRLRSG